ncbi:MAG: hypothetical protein ACWGNP_04555 [Candidatus Bathyarchaeia archaeon]
MSDVERVLKLAEREIKRFSSKMQSGDIERNVEAMNCFGKLLNNYSRLVEQAGLSKATVEDEFAQVDLHRPPRGFMRSGK